MANLENNIVFDNIIFSIQRGGGISVVWRELLSHLGNDVGHRRYLEYASADKNFIRRSMSCIDVPDLQTICRLPVVAERYISPSYKVDEPHVFHSSYYRVSSNPLARNVTTVHDFIYEFSVKGWRRKLHCWQKYKAIREAEHIVCISENTRNDLLKFLPDVDSSKISVVYNGVCDEFKQLESVPYPELSDYVLYVGSRQPYKNFNFAIETVSQTPLKLYVVGSALRSAEIRLLEKYLPGRYKFADFPDNDELNRLYNSVFCLLYPSSGEGFGLPVVEAQRAACPAIALSCTSLPEVMGSRDTLLDSLSRRECRRLLDMLKDPLFRESVIAHGLENAARFSWQKMADLYAEIYKSLIK